MDSAAKLAVETLADTAFYLCSLIPTITQQQQTLPAVLAELGFFFLPTESVTALEIKANTSSYEDTLSTEVFSLRVGVDAAGHLNPAQSFYLYRYYNTVSSRRRRCIGGRDAHDVSHEGRIVGVAIGKLGEWLDVFIIVPPASYSTSRSTASFSIPASTHHSRRPGPEHH